VIYVLCIIGYFTGAILHICLGSVFLRRYKLNKSGNLGKLLGLIFLLPFRIIGDDVHSLEAYDKQNWDEFKSLCYAALVFPIPLSLGIFASIVWIIGYVFYKAWCFFEKKLLWFKQCVINFFTLYETVRVLEEPDSYRGPPKYITKKIRVNPKKIEPSTPKGT